MSLNFANASKIKHDYMMVYSIPTVDTLMELVVENGPGLYIELKKPSWHNQFLTSVQTTMEDMLLSKLKQFGYLEHDIRTQIKYYR